MINKIVFIKNLNLKKLIIKYQLHSILMTNNKHLKRNKKSMINMI